MMFSPPRLKSLLFVLSLLAARLANAAYTPMQLALDDIWLTFTSAGNSGWGPWTVHSNPADCLDDTDGMKSPVRSTAGDSWVQAVITGPDTIDFMWALETTAANTLTFSVDGVVQASCEPAASARWSWVSVEIPPGQHVLRWNYHQAGSAGGRALLDRVGHSTDNWPSLAASPFLQFIMGESASEFLPAKLPGVSWELYSGTLPAGMVLESSGLFTGIPADAGTWRPLVRISAPSYSLYYRITIEVLDKPTLASALDSRRLRFTASASDGASFWIPQARGSRNDTDCVAAGLAPPVQRSPSYQPGWSLLQTTLEGPDRLSYWIRVANGRVLLMLDGREYRSHSPGAAPGGWERAWLTIPAGTHTVGWKYESFLDRSPTAWVDDIRRQSDGRVFLGFQPVISPLPDGSVNFAVPVEGTVSAWSATGLPAGFTLDPGTGLISGNPEERGVSTVRLSASGSSFGDEDDVLAIVDNSMPSAAAADLPNSRWTTGVSGARWFGQNLLTHDGTDALRSPPVAPGATAALSTSVRGPATLRWWWHIPAGSAGDECLLLLNGSPVARISGETAWLPGSAAIPAGFHDLTWRWKSDDSGDPAEEAAIVDEVSLGP